MDTSLSHESGGCVAGACYDASAESPAASRNVGGGSQTARPLAAARASLRKEARRRMPIRRRILACPRGDEALLQERQVLCRVRNISGPNCQTIEICLTMFQWFALGSANLLNPSVAETVRRGTCIVGVSPPFTREGSQVQSLSRPSFFPGFRGYSETPSCSIRHQKGVQKETLAPKFLENPWNSSMDKTRICCVQDFASFRRSRHGVKQLSIADAR